jgi:predicted permease
MGLARRISNLFRRSRIDREISAEMESHIALRTEENIAHGMMPAEARRDALLRFGNRTATKESTIAADAALGIDSILRDVRYALRQLGKNPGFAVTAILVLALGIGASVAIFAFVDAALIKPLPYADPVQLVSVYETTELCPLCNISYQNFRDWQKSDLPFSSMQAWGYAGYSLRGSEGTESVDGARVSDGFFRTLGVTPILGRDFYAGEDLPGKPRTVLISYATWQNRFGGNRNIVGQAISLSDITYTIIGVLPREFHFAPRGEADFWAALNNPSGCDQRRGCHGLFGLARMKDGATLQMALAGMQTIARQLEKQYPDSNHGFGATVVPLSETVVGKIRPILLTLFCGACLLLVIAYINIASLLLVRAESRKRETAVRGALGATTSRLLRQFITESLVLVAAGSVMGMGIAYAAMKIMVKLLPIPFRLVPGFSPHVLAFACLAAIIAVALFTVPQALRIMRGHLRGDLAEGGRSAAGNSWRNLGSRLIVAELAIAVVLLAAAGLLVKSLGKLLQVDIGFEQDHLASLVVSAPRSYLEGNRFMILERQIVSRMESLPGVQSAGITSHLPVRDWDGGVPLVIPGRPVDQQRHDVPERDVSSAYLKTIGARLLRGRYFTEAEDNDAKPRVVVLNETLAKQYFPHEDPIGKQLAYEGSHDTMQIIGVVADIKEGSLDTPNQAVVYVPFMQDASRSFHVVTRTAQDAGGALPAMAAAIHQIDPNLATSDAITISDSVNDSNAAFLHRSSAWLVGGFAAIALLLGTVGLYGVIAYSVSQRTREIGVRMALGAQRSSVYQLVLHEAGWLTVAGIGVGLIGAMFAATLMRKLLFGTQAWDISTLAAVAAVMAVFALLASYFPARRAASVNPVEALRAE